MEPVKKLDIQNDEGQEIYIDEDGRFFIYDEYDERERDYALGLEEIVEAKTTI